MNKTQLTFEGLSEIVGSNGLAVIILTDMKKKRSISIVCDEVMKYQISIRSSLKEQRNRFLPEVMIHMISDITDIKRYEVNIQDIVEGEYKTVLTDTDNGQKYDIRFSDAILLSRISPIPIYIDNNLMNRQSSPYKENSCRMAIPINTLNSKRLKEELNRAIDEENYHLASQIKEELDKRKDI